MHVACRQHLRDRQIQVGNPEIACSVVGLLRSLLQEVAVKYRSENLHMAGLALREKVSRSSEVEIALADGETRAGFTELFQNGKTLFGVS